MIGLEEAERIINAGLIGTRPTDEGLKFGLALCAENKKLRAEVKRLKAEINTYRSEQCIVDRQDREIEILEEKIERLKKLAGAQ